MAALKHGGADQTRGVAVAALNCVSFRSWSSATRTDRRRLGATSKSRFSCNALIDNFAHDRTKRYQISIIHIVDPAL
jgi:hypothetical protein